MGVPTTTNAPQNVYAILDDYSASDNGPTTNTTGTGSGDQMLEFTAASLSNATTVAYLISSALQRPVRLMNKYVGSPPWTLVTGAAPGVALTTVPSGVGF